MSNTVFYSQAAASDDAKGTNGGMLAPVDGIVNGGQILAVNVDVLT